MRHRDCHMLFDALAADPEPCRGLGMAQAVELVQAERAGGAGGQPVNRHSEARGVLTRDQIGFGDWLGLRFGAVGALALLDIRPILLADRTPSARAETVEDEVLGNAVQIGTAVADRSGRHRSDFEPHLLHNVFCLGGATGSGSQKTYEGSPVLDV